MSGGEADVVLIGTSPYLDRVARVLKARGFEARRVASGRGLSTELDGASAVVFEGGIDAGAKLRALTDGVLIALLRTSREEEMRALWEMGVDECVAADLSKPALVPWVVKKALWEQAKRRETAGRDGAAASRAGREERRAIKDALTGLYNRRHAEERIAAMLGRATREKKGVAITLLDIDHFKQINDTYGHDAGDRILIGVARYLSREMRVGDFLARWGGEEFVAALYAVDQEGARSITGRLISGIKGRRVDEEIAACGGVTLSAGVCVADHSEGGDPERAMDSLLKKADEALYLAKNQGRDRVVVYERERKA